MTGLAQDQATAIIRTDARNHATELARKFGLGEDQLQPRQSLGGGSNGGRMGAQAGGELAQDPMHLARLLFREAHQFIVEFDGFKRLDEKRVAAAAGPVNHSLYPPLAARDYGNDEAIIANRDEVFLQRAVRMMRAEEAFERALDSLALLFNLAPQPSESDTRMIRQYAAGKNLAAQLLRQFAKIGDRRAVRR